ncbi:non-canonical purine NTP pyrophosphatase [Candidatus Saccharibacteria bacterium]|nr:non-canonical purine NTP pyrophosphatase [Candidatus Saccharibacteria bacterium]
MRAVYVTGNANKARYFSELIGLPIEHQKADVHEIQSLDPLEISEHKAKEAYKQIKKPLIVEDVSVTIEALNKLPGPFIRWFIEEVGLEGVCRLADNDPLRKATASCVYSFFDGKNFEHFEGNLEGKISEHPRGREGFGWNPIFIPHYSKQTMAEMDDMTFKEAYLQIKPINQLKKFLKSIK